jgi:esterase/lipase superfamily enzyme
MWRVISFICIGLSCFLFSACSILSDLAPIKEEVVDVQDWLVVPIFYATNRDRANSGQIDFIEKKNNNTLLFGVKNIIVPCPKDILTKPEIIDRMGWRLLHLAKPISSDTRPPLPEDKKYKVPDKELLSTEVVNAFDKYRGITGSAEVILFVHGCCATFKTNMERAAKLAIQMQIPVIVYDWVSPIGFSHYLENETLAQQTYDGFCDFLDNIAKYVPTNKTSVLGHSMGAAFVDEAFVRRFERSHGGKILPKYQEIIFSQPDLDAIVYLNHENKIVSQANKTRIFMVLDDRRLSVSALAHEGHERLGRPGPLLDKLCHLDKQDIIDMTASGIGHNLPANFIASMHSTGTINESGYKLLQKSPHLFVLEKTDRSLSAGH